MGERLKLGVAGCGDIAGYMAWMSRLVRPVRLAACCDVDPKRANDYARRFHIPAVFTDYERMLDAADVDVVYLAVPHHLHAAMIGQAIHVGKPVLVEKPLARTLDEGERLVELIGQAGVKVGVNYQYRYDARCYTLAGAVQAGELGKIHSVRINVPWHRDDGYFSRSAWHRTIAAAGGGTLITQGSHFLDVVLWALGERPVSAMGSTARPRFDVEVETLAHGIVETSGGTLIQIASSMVAAREQPASIEVYGERSTAVYRDGLPSRVHFYGASVKKQPPAPVWGIHALQRSLAGFVQWVQADRPYLIPAAETLPVLAAVDAIYRSAQSGKKEVIR